jgi:hypothetical protein
MLHLGSSLPWPQEAVSWHNDAARQEESIPSHAPDSARECQQFLEESEMTRRFVLFSLPVVLASILGSRFLQAQESGTKAAQTSAEEWLSLLDNQSYAASWDTAAGLFKNAVSYELRAEIGGR